MTALESRAAETAKADEAERLADRIVAIGLDVVALDAGFRLTLDAPTEASALLRQQAATRAAAELLVDELAAATERLGALVADPFVALECRGRGRDLTAFASDAGTLVAKWRGMFTRPLGAP